jgi:hypothetical protein
MEITNRTRITSVLKSLRSKIRVSSLVVLTAQLYAANFIEIQNLAQVPQVNRPFTISRIMNRGEFPTGIAPQARLNGVALLPTQSDVKTSWPDGSVKHVILSFLVPAIEVNGAVTIDFVSQPTPDNGGFLDKQDMLNFNGGTWGADMELTRGGSARTADLRAMLKAWNGTDGRDDGLGLRYWLKGPICTQVIIEDRSVTRAFDLGFDTLQPFHPIFIATFFPGSITGVRIDYIGEVANTEAMEDLSYSLVLKAGSPLALVYNHAAFVHAATTRWHKQFYSGTPPSGWMDEFNPGVNVNHNLAYWSSTGAIANYDRSVIVNDSSHRVAQFNATDRCDINGHADYQLDMGTAGGRDEIGPVTVWTARWLLAQDPDSYYLAYSHGSCSFAVPMHYREANSGKTFNSGQSAVGLPLSIDTRPTLWAGDWTYGPPDSADQLTAKGALNGNGWIYDTAHVPDFCYTLYLFSGEWYWLEELQFQAAMDLALTVPGTDRYSRGGTWGYFNESDRQTRGQAWGRRDIAEAAYATPDASALKLYFAEKVSNNITIEEGELNISSSAGFAPCTTSPYDETKEKSAWCWGNRTIQQNLFGPPALHPGPNPLFIAQSGNTNNVSDKFIPGVCTMQDAFYQWAYKFDVHGHLQDLGFPVGPLNSRLFSVTIHLFADPAFNPWLANSDEICTQDADGQVFTSWAAIRSAFRSAYTPETGSQVNLQAVSGWWDPASDDKAGDGYPHMWQAAASYVTNLTADGLSGQAAWDWSLAHVSRTPLAENPQYAIVPRETAPVSNP